MLCYLLFFFSFHLNTGMFTCNFTSTSTPNIINRASAYLDVALLPQIFITSDPQFPNCISNGKMKVVIKCIINNSTEPYSVTWDISLNPLKKTTSKLHRYFLSHCALFYIYKYKKTFVTFIKQDLMF